MDKNFTIGLVLVIVIAGGYLAFKFMKDKKQAQQATNNSDDSFQFEV